MTMISFSCVDLTELRFTSQLLLELPVIPTTKQNNTDKKLDFSTGSVFVRDKSENTKLSILIKYILNSSAQSIQIKAFLSAAVRTGQLKI